MAFEATKRLPHLLPPQAYGSDHFAALEQDHVFRDTWSFVCTTQELANAGDFVTRLVGKHEIQIRNFDGKICALSNVCAHRHALICSEASGNTPTMKCQYHGWEYRPDGNTGKIPQPKNFVPYESHGFSIPKYQVEIVGQLVFVNLSKNPPSIEQWMGKEFRDFIADRFSIDHWSLTLKWSPEYDANWKVPIENSLEAYHVPNIHPATFKEDPGAGRSEHKLFLNRTYMQTTLPFAPHNRMDSWFQKTESRFVKWLGYETSSRYSQHHVFPNLLFSFTDAISLVNFVSPIDRNKCVATIRQFGRAPKQPKPIKRLCSRIWGKLTASITRKILEEDRSIFASIQRGLENSPNIGVIGICEERIHAFQNDLIAKIPPNSKETISKE